MFPKPLPVFLAFVGGCLSTAALIGVWRADDDPSTSPGPTTTVVPPSTVRGDGLSDEGRTAPEVEPQREPGRSVADVLTRLETAYRQELAAAAAPPAEVPAGPEAAIAPAEAAPVAPPVPPPAPVPPAVDPLPPTVPVAAAPTPATSVYVENVQQEVIHGDVHQGDVNQAQQVALFQTLQVLTLPANGRVARPAPTQPSKTRRPPHQHIAITDPNNPWGFDFPPTPLVK